MAPAVHTTNSRTPNPYSTQQKEKKQVRCANNQLPHDSRRRVAHAQTHIIIRAPSVFLLPQQQPPPPPTSRPAPCFSPFTTQSSLNHHSRGSRGGFCCPSPGSTHRSHCDHHADPREAKAIKARLKGSLPFRDKPSARAHASICKKQAVLRHAT